MISQNKYASHLPVYNIKAAARLIGLLPVTIRAWERRYGLPNPSRGEQGYRLYSEYDVCTLRWLKGQIDTGLTISRAVDYLNEIRSGGKDPTEYLALLPKNTNLSNELTHISQEILVALLDFNESVASELLAYALNAFSKDEVFSNLMQPLMVEMGERWHRGEITIANEHYATNFVMQHLMSLLASASAPQKMGVIIATCAPGETHQIGLLMLVILLRYRGWDVKYFGENISINRLEVTLNQIHPRLMLLSATLPANAGHFHGIEIVLERILQPRPTLIFGGQGFSQYRLPDSLPALYLSTQLSQSVATIEEIMEATNEQ